MKAFRLALLLFCVVSTQWAWGATRLWYVTSGEQLSEAGLSVINADGTNQQIDLVSDSTFGLGSAWVETVIDPAAGFYFILQYNIATGGSATLFRGVLGSNAAPTAAVTFTNPTDADVLGGLQIDTVNHHIYIGYIDYDNSTNFNVQPATTGIIQMDYNASSGAVTNTTSYFVNEQANPIPADGLGYYAPNDFALGDGSLFFVQQAFETSNQIYRVNLTTKAINVVLQQSQFPANWSGGVINDVEIDTTNHLLFFSLHDENQPGSATHNGVFYIADTATGSTAATKFTLPGVSASFSPNKMVFDPVSRVLYVGSEETSDGPGNGVPDDVIYAFQVNASGTAVTALLHTFSVGFGDDPAGTTANIGGMAIQQNTVPALDLDGNNSSGAAGSNYQATFTENGAAVPIADTDATITDDDTNEASATITLSNHQTNDLLAVNGSLPAGISASSYNASTGVLTLAGSASRASYQTALHQIVFSSTSENPNTTDRSINVTVNDGTTDSNVATATVHVISVNDAPTMNTISDPIAIPENSGLQTVNLSGISAGPAAEAAQIITISPFSSNTALIPTPSVSYTSPNATGSVSYTPTANLFGSAMITLTVQDNGGTANGGIDSIQRSFNVVVNPTSDQVKSGAKIQAQAGGVYASSFTGNPNTQYTVQYSPDLTPNSWVTLGLRTANGNGAFSINDTPPAGTAKRFYRATFP